MCTGGIREVGLRLTERGLMVIARAWYMTTIQIGMEDNRNWFSIRALRIHERWLREAHRRSK